MTVNLNSLSQHLETVLRDSTRSTIMSVLESLSAVVPGLEINHARIQELNHPPAQEPGVAHVQIASWGLSPFYGNCWYSNICTYNKVPLSLKCSWTNYYSFDYPQINYVKLYSNTLKWSHVLRTDSKGNPIPFRDFVVYHDEHLLLKAGKPPTLEEFMKYRPLVTQWHITSDTAAKISVSRNNEPAMTELQLIEAARLEFAKSHKRYIAKVAKQAREAATPAKWEALFAEYIKDRFLPMLADFKALSKADQKTVLS